MTAAGRLVDWLAAGGLVAVAAIITAAVTWRRHRSDTWESMVRTQAEHVVKPLRDQVTALQAEVDDLRSEVRGLRRTYRDAVGYIRLLLEWIARRGHEDDTLPQPPESIAHDI